MPVSRDSDPSTLFEAARDGDRVALARLLSLVERGGDDARPVAGLAYKSPGEAYTVGITGAPGAGKSTLTDRLVATAGSGLGTTGTAPPVATVRPVETVRRRWPGGGAGHRPVLPVLRRGHPRRPGPHAEPRPRRRGVHPLDGHPRPPGRPGGGRARRRPGALGGGLAGGAGRDGGGGPAGGRGGGGHRHHRGGGQPGMGRRHPGQQGGPAGDRRPVRHQQGRPPGRRNRPGATSSRCSISPSWGSGGRRSSRRWPRPARGSTSCGTPSAATGDHQIESGRAGRERRHAGCCASSDQILVARVERADRGGHGRRPVRRHHRGPGRPATSTPTRRPTGCWPGMFADRRPSRHRTA